MATKNLWSLLRSTKYRNQQVVARDVPKFFSAIRGPNGERLDVTEIPYDQVKDKVKYNDDDLVFAKNERRYFLRDQLEINGIWTEVPASQTVDKQDGEDIAPFQKDDRYRG